MPKDDERELRAVVGLTYPVGESLAIVRKAGGIQKLTPEQRSNLQLRHVKPGERCDDAPVENISSWLANGRIQAVGKYLTGLSVAKAKEYVRSAKADQVDALELEELANRNRKTVLAAIAARREEGGD